MRPLHKNLRTLRFVCLIMGFCCLGTGCDFFNLDDPQSLTLEEVIKIEPEQNTLRSGD